MGGPNPSPSSAPPSPPTRTCAPHDFALAKYNAPSGLDERVYAQHDANYNITALTDTFGTVIERYLYDPYGQRTITDASYSSRGSSSYAFDFGFQGGQYVANANLMIFRHRFLSTSLERWMQVDRVGGYLDGCDLYSAFAANPVALLDPLGANVRLHPTNGVVVNRSSHRIKVMGDYLKITHKNPLPGNIKNEDVWYPTENKEVHHLRSIYAHDTWMIHETSVTNKFWVNPGGNTWEMRLAGKTLVVDVDFIIAVRPGRAYTDATARHAIKLSGAPVPSNPGKVGPWAIIVHGTNCKNGVWWEKWPLTPGDEYPNIHLSGGEVGL